VLEDRLVAIFGMPTQFPSLRDKMRVAWQAFAEEYAGRDDCERLLIELCPPPPATGLLEAFKAQESRAPSIEEMKRRADSFGTSAGPVSEERGQALIMLAARAAAAGRYDEAIAAQTEVVAIAGELYGSGSRQRAIATINLAALFFRALRYTEAFEHYSEGISQALREGAPVQALGGSVENLATAGFEAGKFTETGHTFRVFAELVSPSPAAFTLWFISVSALARVGNLTDALDGFEQALSVHAQMDHREGEPWLESIVTVAGGLIRQLDDAEKRRLRSMLLRLAEKAQAAGWSNSLHKLEGWLALQAALNF
jgi:tetratricopeptide (TPR) repeat protein